MKLKAFLLAGLLVFCTQNTTLTFAEEMSSSKDMPAGMTSVENMEDKAESTDKAMPASTVTSQEKSEQATEAAKPEKSESELIADTKKSPSLYSYYDLGKYYFQQRQYDKAETAFSKAQELGKKWPTDATYIDTVYYLGDVYYNTGRYADSEKKYRQVIGLGLNDDELHSYLGDALRKQSKYKQAKEEYEKALQLNADNSIAKDGIDDICKVTKCSN